MQGALKSEDSPAPVMYLLWKDHKQYTTTAPTRPVCAATVGPLTRALEVLTMILTSIMDDVEPVMEVSSSEEMQRAILDANIRIKEEKIPDPVVFSMDVKALYPSLDLEDISEAVMTMVEETELGMEDIDIRHLATYLAAILSKEEQEQRGVTSHLPRRTVELEGRQRGIPTVAYLDSDWYYSTTKGEGKTKKMKWNWVEWQEPSPEEGRSHR